MKVYADTSFLISLYSLDANSVAAAQTMQGSKHVHVLSTLAEVETINALELRVFRKEISPLQAKSSFRHFEKDLSQGVFQLVRMPDDTFERARQISHRSTARLGTRSMDLLHVAAALELNVDYLYSFDQQQCRLAKKLGLKVN